MKHLLFTVFLVILVFGCSNNDDPQNDNPNLIDPLVDLTLNLSLPQYQPLKFANNSVIVNSQGIRGIIIFTPDATQYFAYDLSDPNHPPNSCSRMEVDELIVSCPCETDENTYILPGFGQHITNPDLYPMQSYRAVRSGDVVRVTN